MKRVLLILTMVIGCSLLASCEKETMLTVNQTSLSFNNSGGSQTVNLIANKVWSASSNQGWCKVSPSSGDGSDNSNFTLSVSCEANTTYDERSCTITVVCEELTSTITVKQAEGKGLIVSQTEYNLTNESQTISVEVQANVQYTVSIDDACKSWIKQESTKGLSSNTIKFAISKNESYDGREGKITVKQTDGSLSGTVVVKQSQQNGLFVTTSEYNLSNEKHTLTVEVKANVEFEVKSNADWIKYVETKGLKTSQIVLDVAANDFYDEREGTVIVKQKNGNLEGVITIRQEQNYGILLSQSYFSVSNEAETVEIEVKYNVDYDVVIPDVCKDWISVVSTKGLSSRNYTIAIAKNETYDNREGSITFKQKNGALSGTVEIHQSQTEGIIAEYKEYVVSAAAQQFIIKVSSNTYYEVVIDEGCKDWLSRVQTKGLVEETLSFQVAQNDGKERKGKITFKNENIQEVVVVRQEADGYIEFDDEFFKAYCIENFDTNGDWEISYTEASAITRIDVSTNNIKSVKGIEYMPKLEYLLCTGRGENQYGKLESLDVSNNTALIGLSCYNNQLKSLDVSNNTKLKNLDCYMNHLTNLDLSNNTKLQSLQCFMNQIKSLNLSNHPALKTIICGSNLIESIDVSNSVDLNWLICANNQITSLDVSNNTKLTVLSCGANKLTSLDVSKNTMLTSLECQTNQINSLDVSNNTELTTLLCYDNQINSLNLSNNTSLTALTCYNNKLTSLDLSKNALLESVGCSYNQLTSLDVSNNPLLIGISCSNNQLTNLDVSKNALLLSLDCYMNQLTSLDLSNNIALTYLMCTDNQLTSLDLSKNTELTSLTCCNNQLTSLDLNKNTKLQTVQCYINQLTNLEVSACTEMKRLSCHTNQLTSLDVSKNTALTFLQCDSNKLTEIDVSNNTALTEFWCHSNQLTSLDVSNNLRLNVLGCFYNPHLTEIWLKVGQTIAQFHYDSNISTIKYK